MSRPVRPVLSQGDIEQELLDVSDALEDLVRDYADLGERAAKAEVRFKVAHARVYLAAHGTIPERAARADADTEVEAMDAEVLSAKAKYLREAIASKRARLDVLRSLNSNVRAVTTG